MCISLILSCIGTCTSYLELGTQSMNWAAGASIILFIVSDYLCNYFWKDFDGLLALILH